ncbi:MAG: hypothetical protein MJA83_08975 [Gammaproteobacteria bacterium]|nr:hypothetical protein [Gammaproteobacteria bacterium]
MGKLKNRFIALVVGGMLTIAGGAVFADEAGGGAPAQSTSSAPAGGDTGSPTPQDEAGGGSPAPAPGPDWVEQLKASLGLGQ